MRRIEKLYCEYEEQQTYSVYKRLDSFALIGLGMTKLADFILNKITFYPRFMLERNGKLTALTVADVTAPTLTKEIIQTIKRSATLNTDEWLGYKGITNLYKHTVVKHGQGEYVRGVAYTNNIECFWSILKRGIFDTTLQVKSIYRITLMSLFLDTIQEIMKYQKDL